jgi:outer membrane protein, heavy metal efflux system
MASIFSAKAWVKEWVSRHEGHERRAKFEGVHISGADVSSGAGDGDGANFQRAKQQDLRGKFMWRLMRTVFAGALLGTIFSAGASAQRPLTWDEIKARFEANNPTLGAGVIGIDEAKAEEITAFLRPNPTLTVGADQIDPFSGGPAHGAFAYLLPTLAVSYLHERQHKRELRLQSAKQGTDITISQQDDLDRTLLFALRSAFVGALQAKAVLDVVNANLAYWDKVLDVSRTRFQVGDIAQIDLDRLELQRSQFESDVQTAEVNLRTSKITLLALLNDRTPIDKFDVTGAFDFNEQLGPLDDFHQTAMDNRPDLRAAVQAVDKAKTDHKLAVADGSTDPTFGFDIGRDPPIDQYFGVNVSIPLRIFDRNQGEKLRTQLDIDRNQKLLDAQQAQVFNDVDSGYAQVISNLILLRPYRQVYLQQAVRVRETVRFAWEHGGASLLDFLSAEQDFRTVQLNYVNLIGSYLLAAAQLNMAVGRETIQ